MKIDNQNNRIFAGIVTYNPNIERLKKNIVAILPQVEQVVVVDNASNNIIEIKELCNTTGAILACNEKNEGLAKALNQIFRDLCINADWILTLDQDSICPEDYVAKCSRYIDEKVGIINAPYLETNSGYGAGIRNESPELVTKIKRTITSGALVNKTAYFKTAGYDEYFCIDYVDFDFSMKINEAGYSILKMNDTYILHELGNTTIKKILFFKIRYTEHSPEREYIIARNIVIYIRRYHKKYNTGRDFLSLIKHFTFTVIFDNRKSNKLKCLFRGVRDGLKYKETNQL